MVLLSGVLFIPGFAHAACPITPSFTYDPAAKAGGVATVWVNTPANCMWEVTSAASWIRILTANYGTARRYYLPGAAEPQSNRSPRHFRRTRNVR